MAQLHRELVADLIEVSPSFHEVLEALEVLLDGKTVRRLKVGRGSIDRASTRLPQPHRRSKAL